MAVLPITHAPGNAAAKAGLETSEAVLLDELPKAARFEIVRITREKLESLTGKSQLRADEKLPPTYSRNSARKAAAKPCSSVN